MDSGTVKAEVLYTFDKKNEWKQFVIESNSLSEHKKSGDNKEEIKNNNFRKTANNRTRNKKHK